jgi:DNA-binding CsgD family transcriptional regulator
MANEHVKDQRRNRRGKFTATIETANREARAAQLHADGLKYREIAAEMGIDLHQVYDYVQSAMAKVVQQPAENAVAYSLRNLYEERARLLDTRAELEALKERQHVTVSQGHVVYADDGAAVPDDEFTLKTIDRLMRCDEQLRRNDESTRKLLGLDQPAKTQISGGVTYEVVGINPEELR